MWLLILQVILNLPALIKAIIEIWKLIKEIKDPKEKAIFEDKFKTVLRQANSKKQAVQADHDSLNDLLAELKMRKATP